MDRKSWIQMSITIAVVLVVFFLVQNFLLPKPAAVNTAANAPSPQPQPPGTVGDTTPAARVPTPPTAADKERGFDPISRKEAKTYTLANEKLTAVFSERGGVLDSLTFVNAEGKTVYLHTPDDPTVAPKDPLTLIRPSPLAPDHAPGPLALRLDTNDAMRNTSRWSTSGVEKLESGAARIVFRFPAGDLRESDNTALRKSITLLPGATRFEIELTVESFGDAVEKTLGLWGPIGIGVDGSSLPADSNRVALYGSTLNPRWTEYRQGDMVSHFHGRLEDFNRHRAEQNRAPLDAMDTVWMDGVDPTNRFLAAHGIKTRYFVAFLASDPDTPSVHYSGHVMPIGVPHSLAANIGVSLVAPTLDVPAGGSASTRMAFYAGPRDQAILTDAWRAAPPKTDLPVYWTELAPHGWPGIISGPLTVLLKALTAAVGPGLAIILLTLIVRVVLSPLSYRGQKSMAAYTRKMKVVKPKLDKIKAKYEGKKDRDSQLAMLTETRMAMKEQDVGLVPLGGCLPIFLQMPIFIGLYATFGGAFFLRQADFLWIHDLSMPDASIPWSTAINLPIIGAFVTHNGVFTINILPLMWIGLSVLQMRMQPKPDDPQQAAMQRQMGCIFPLMGLMFYAFASGFALYFIISSIYSLIETRIVKWWLIRTGVMEPPRKPTAGPNDKPEFRGIAK